MADLNFAAALDLQALTQLKLAIDLVMEFYQLHGRPPTPSELKAQMLRPL